LTAVDLAPVNTTVAEPLEMIRRYSALRHANWWFDVPHRRWVMTKLLTSQ
jgi:hypothetical protein